jgi:hypothetical protein
MGHGTVNHIHETGLCIKPIDQTSQNPCGSELARDSGLSVSISIDWYTAIASELPQGFPFGHESVMTMCSMVPSVAALGGSMSCAGLRFARLTLYNGGTARL